MIIIVLLLALGFAVGIFFRGKLKPKYVSKLLYFIILMLLFVMGAQVGASQEIMENLMSLGFEALVITLGAVAGSLVVVYFVEHYFFKR